MPSYEPTDEEIAALTRETDEEEALEERQRQARRRGRDADQLRSVWRAGDSHLL